MTSFASANFNVAMGQAQPLGLSLNTGWLNVAVCAPAAQTVWFCLFDTHERECARVALPQQTDGIWHGALAWDELMRLPDLNPNAIYYGFRADGVYLPEQGFWFDPHKLLLDPYAKEVSAPFVYHADLGAPRAAQIDTAALLPKAIFSPAWANLTATETQTSDAPPKSPRLIYEVSVKGLTQLHPEIPESVRGTIAALREPVMLNYFQQLGVDAVELMPIAAWMDERHLPPLGLRNAWGYNPVGMMVLDPRLCPGGVRELRETIDTLHAHGIRVILDVVFNHTAESDEGGSTLSLRGLDARHYYRHVCDERGCRLDNVTGCGHTLDATHSGVMQLCLDSLRYWTALGVDGFRFDLATVLGRDATGFDAQAPLLRAIEQDPALAQVWLIAEPWDIGAGGYQLGQFAPKWLEWNDRFRDTVRRFWRGDEGMVSELATRIAGSADVFAYNSLHTRSVNFIAAHDGMSLYDITAYRDKHNDANGEYNRDGHGDNLSWNHGVEGPADAAIGLIRRRDGAALLATLLCARGTPMLTAGDEMGRTQRGNNNAYAQDNAITWLDWAHADEVLMRFCADLNHLRAQLPSLFRRLWLRGVHERADHELAEAQWWQEQAHLMTPADWQSPQRRSVGLSLYAPNGAYKNWADARTGRVLMWFNAHDHALEVYLPPAQVQSHWRRVVDSAALRVWADDEASVASANDCVQARSVCVWLECFDFPFGSE